MTRRDYVLIANVFHGTKPNADSVALQDQWLYDVQAMASALSATNPKFDHDRFVTACRKGA